MYIAVSSLHSLLFTIYISCAPRYRGDPQSSSFSLLNNSLVYLRGLCMSITFEIFPEAPARAMQTTSHLALSADLSFPSSC